MRRRATTATLVEEHDAIFGRVEEARLRPVEQRGPDLAAEQVTDLVTGDCLTGPPVTGAPATETTDDTVTDCAGGHDGEVIGVVTYTQGPEVAYPGQEQVAAYADEQCPVAFEAYVGVPYGNSSLALLSLWPTEASWSGGDREAVCVAYEPDTQLTGSVQGRGTP